MDNILEIKNLCKTYKDFKLQDVNLSVPKGFVTGFIGPNGAGKSTTIKSILNLVKPSSGEILIFDKPLIGNEEELLNRIGIVMDEGNFYEDFTINQMTKLIAPTYKEWNSGLFEYYIKKFNLPLNKKISKLSKGMHMKYALAIALSHNADLLIMDEPSAGLDPIVREELLDIFRETIKDGNRSILLSTHITSDLDKIADYVVMIDGGKVIFDKSKDDLIETHARVSGSMSLLTQRNCKYLISWREGEFGFEGLTDDKEKAAWAFGPQAIMERPNIETIMLYYARRGSNASND